MVPLTLFFYYKCPLQTIFCVSQLFITFQKAVKSTFLIPCVSYYFQFYGTNTEQKRGCQIGSLLSII
nr:MAG TPA: hypothetical protein [Caudoviricetes sp.]